MARRYRRRNPVDWLGENVTDLLWEIGGLAGAAVLNDHIIGPAVQGIAGRALPGASTGVLANALNGATTAVSGLLLGSLAEHIFGHSEGELAKRGGVALGIGRIALSPLPGAAISVSIPQANQLPSFNLGSSQATSAKALPPANAAMQPAATAFAGSSMGF